MDADGISIDENQLSLGSFTTIKDSAGNAAVLTHPPLTAQGLHKVDAVVPTVTATAITSSAGTDKHYKAGDTLQTTVTFSENVYVTGTPQVTLNIGDAEKVVDYTSGSGTDTLVFEYTVVTGDTDTDGVSMDANQLALNGATLKDYASNPATLTHPALARQADHKVDTTAPSLIPTGGIEITSSAGGDNHYKIGEKIQISVTFVEKMAVSGTPQLNLKIGAENKPANYTSGAGTQKLVFEYAIATGDADTDGISIGEDADEDGISDEDQFVLDSGTITDIPGNPAVLTHAALPTQPPHKVDGIAPAITTNGIAITSTDPPYTVGKTIGVQVSFSETVYVMNTPQLTLRIGTANRKANYTSGTDTANLVFQYTVAEGDRGADGISIAANQLSFNDGTITDIAGNPAALTHPALDLESDHKVDAVAPWILANGINISSDAGTGNTYKATDNVHVTVSFSEPCT